MRRKFKKEDLKIINKNDLKVGDEVGILKPVMVGYGESFRYPIVVKTKVTRITPARTKIETLHGVITGKYEHLYVIDETAKEMTEIAIHAKNIANKILSRNCNKENIFFNMSDEAIVKLSKKLDEIMEIIKDEYKL